MNCTKINNLHKYLKDKLHKELIAKYPHFKINSLHKYLKDKLHKELIAKYPHFKIIENFNCEEGNFILIKNNENIKKIIGITPINSNSIYSINETFKIEDFTNKTAHFIHETLIIQKKPIIVCDEQGCILCLHKDYNKSGLINRIIKKENLTKSFILDNYDIDYSSFYCGAKSDGINDTYGDLTNENKVIEFIINLY
jgi:hypothetical protein